MSTLAGQAVGIASFFSRAKFWIGKLREEQATTYKNKFYVLIVPNEMRWNSHYYCFSSLLKSKAALKVLLINNYFK